MREAGRQPSQRNRRIDPAPELIAVQSRPATADNHFVLPPSRQILASVYLLAAGLTGAIVGYMVSRIEANFQISALTREHSRDGLPIIPIHNDQMDPAIAPQAPSVVNNVNAGAESAAQLRSTAALSPRVPAPPADPAPPPLPPPVDDLERAARRLDERAHTADRLGDPELADMWRKEAAKLRAVLADRRNQSSVDGD